MATRIPQTVIAQTGAVQKDAPNIPFSPKVEFDVSSPLSTVSKSPLRAGGKIKSSSELLPKSSFSLLSKAGSFVDMSKNVSRETVSLSVGEYDALVSDTPRSVKDSFSNFVDENAGDRRETDADMEKMYMLFPNHWECKRNKNADLCQRYVGDWVKKYFPAFGGTFLNMLDVAGYSGWPFPKASAHTVCTAGKFFTFWIIFDDILEKKGVRNVNQILSAFEKGSDLNDSLAQGWSDCVDEFRFMTEEYMSRWKSDFSNWIQHAEIERAAFLEFRKTQKILSFDEYMNIRRISVGQIPSTHFIFLDCPEHFEPTIKMPEWLALISLSAELVAMTNDLFSFEKDTRDKNLNLLFCFCQGNLTPKLLQAYLDLMMTKMKEFDSLAKAVPESLANGVRWIVFGFWAWHESAERYSDIFPFKEENMVVKVARPKAKFSL